MCQTRMFVSARSDLALGGYVRDAEAGNSILRFPLGVNLDNAF